MTDHGNEKPANRLFERIMAEFERDRVKRRLKAAFRRNPRPAKVRIKDDNNSKD